ncbi:MAG: ATP-binding cassette domain-containing protein [Anaerolineae bacterium]
MKIEIKNIHKRFGKVHANNDITLTFPSGRIVGVLGENGAGKSTLMKILSGFQRADSGEIWLDDRLGDYRSAEAAVAAGIGMLQQDPLDVGAFTVLENFMYGQGGGVFLNRAKARQQLAQVSQRFGFSLDPDTPIAQLSVAQRQQLEIVRLLALHVKTLILDEPTTGISAEQKQLLFDTLRYLVENDGMTVLLVSHKLEDVIALCHEVVVLRAGRLVGAQQMPATTQQLVKLMFGEELAHPSREKFKGSKEVVLSLNGVQLRGKRLHMNEVSLDVHKGEVIGLAGLDGSGQDLVMRACAGLSRLYRGSVQVDGQMMNGRPYRTFMQQGVIFAAAGRIEEGLIAGLTLTEHMALIRERESMLINWDRARRMTADQIQYYHVRGRPENNIEMLSGGNQQRALMALLPEGARVLILEQPTRGLDVDSAGYIWKQLLLRQGDVGTAIIFSSAELDEIVTYSDRILVFYAGKIFEVPDVANINIDELGHMIGGKFTHD